LVLVHEFGHFIVAKRLGVRVEKFSLGFGPKLWSVKRGGTEYLICAFPLGGYVKLAGDEPGEKLYKKDWEFLSRCVFDRFRIIIAGPFLNYILAIIIFSIVFMFGNPTMTTEIGGVLKDYPAQASGIAVGDRIMAVDGKSVRYWEDMTAIIRKRIDGEVRLSVERAGLVKDISIRPIVRSRKDIFGKVSSVALIGVAPSQKIENVRYGFSKSVEMGFKETVRITVMTFKGLWAIVTGSMSVKESMTGPIGIFVLTGAMVKLGFVYVLLFVGTLSVALAIFNVLPVPVLDGGHILFLAIEKIAGRPLPVKTQMMITNVGLALLCALMLFVTYGDIVKFEIFEKIAGFFR
jgi:regulator of sigma E protease